MKRNHKEEKKQTKKDERHLNQITGWEEKMEQNFKRSVKEKKNIASTHQRTKHE